MDEYILKYQIDCEKYTIQGSYDYCFTEWVKVKDISKKAKLLYFKLLV